MCPKTTHRVVAGTREALPGRTGECSSTGWRRSPDVTERMRGAWWSGLTADHVGSRADGALRAARPRLHAYHLSRLRAPALSALRQGGERRAAHRGHLHRLNMRATRCLFARAMNPCVVAARPAHLHNRMFTALLGTSCPSGKHSQSSWRCHVSRPSGASARDAPSFRRTPGK
jgi:hypothetical protein